MLLEFDRKKVDTIIDSAVRQGAVGYVCSVNANIIATADKNPFYKEVVNGALVNICDGSLVALSLSAIRLKWLRPYVGADLFLGYIRNKHEYRYFFVGSDQNTLDGLREFLLKLNPLLDKASFVPLPFQKDPRDFDYAGIASVINSAQPDIIWVSLGAPKQEQFMHYLKPHLKKGVMFGFGAIFTFYSGNPKLKRAPAIFRYLSLEWLYRICQEPRRLMTRFIQELLTMTRMILREIKS
jgi:N-acetylglucosaminyldiphosphoundecaprenol N-acetyl-beta-D-mannosaminyltransferase